jgi:coenzyme F420-0:L-glutamate ligase / coenzyme F420-1:gamma-L-glutamate ligase
VSSIKMFPVRGMPEVEEGDDVAELVHQAFGGAFENEDVVVIAHKIVSKSEGRVRPAGDRAAVILEESKRILRRNEDTTISETRHGFVCANAGVDSSNVPAGKLALLPIDPDRSARRIRARLEHLSGRPIGVIVSDTFGRAWRLGQTNVAIGVAGIEPFLDYRGTLDALGRELSATRICIADELAGAAEVVMGKSDAIPAAVLRGAPVRFGRGSAAEIVRPSEEDLFR